ncbi:MAG: helix-turn-helix transcriptional regulator [Planctomycetota bacterium]
METEHRAPSARDHAAAHAEFTSDPDRASSARSGRGKTPVRDLLQRIHREVSFAQAVLVSTMPRGGVQVIGPDYADDGIVRGLSRLVDGQDRVTWSALLTGKPAVSAELWPSRELTGSEFESAVLRPSGLGDQLAVPMADVLLPGYQGALVLFREASAQPFTAADGERVAALGKDIEKQLHRSPAPSGPMPHELATPMIAFGPGGQVLYPADGEQALAGLSGRLRSQLEQVVRKALDKRGTDAGGKRVVIPDDRGDLWAFRVRRVESYPALTGPAGLSADMPVVFVTHQPAPADFAAVTAEDVAADDEVARLVPAVRFMYDEHRNGPTLEVIAKHVHLSPFHFHRRFTELLGLTPKHYLFDCQIDTAKRQLVAGIELAEIARHCGFAHQSHFTSRFKQATGLTPTRWRKLAQAK